MERIKDILIEEVGITRTTTKYYSKAVTIHWAGKRVVTKILNYLYKNATIYMQRKYNKYLYMVTRQSNLQ